MNKISIKGVLVGGLTSLVAAFVLVVPFVLFFGYIGYTAIAPETANMPKEQMQAAAAAAIENSPWWRVMPLLMGLGCSVLGGYVAARFAKHYERLNGLLSALLFVVFDIYGIATGKYSGSLLGSFALVVSAPACGWLGGYLRLVRKRAKGSIEREK
ncbi:MAG: hypothetical protein ACYC9J_06520 [Sulfuricaulis sp.]